MNAKVLLVDDEINILNGYKRHLRKQFDIDTALGGQEGLKMISSNGPFAVVVSDMRMPEMNGLEFLQQVKSRAPDTVRMMLTGNIDQQTTVGAVNEGNVYRFINKPCHPDQLASAIEAGAAHYQLITAERELLEGTLNGAINLLTDILSMVCPELFGRAVGLRQRARELGKAMEMSDTWAFEMATMLSPIASVTVPPDILALQKAGGKLSTVQKEILEALPETASKLLKNIPRLDRVAEIVLYQEKAFDGSGFPQTKVSGNNIPLESRALKIVRDMTAHEQSGMAANEALELMNSKPGQYDPVILQIAGELWSDGATSITAIMDVRIIDLLPGQKIMGNIVNEHGQLLIAAGTTVTETIIERLHNLHRLKQISEPIQIEIA